MDATLLVVQKLAQGAGVELQAMQKALSSLSSDELLTLQMTLVARTKQALKEGR